MEKPQVKGLLSLPNGTAINSILSKYKAYYPSIIAIIVLLIVGQLLSPGFASLNNIGSLLAISSILAIIAIGQSLVVISGNFGIDLSLGAIVSMGALIGPMIANGLTNRILISILILAMLGGTIGLINGVGIQLLKIPALAMTLVMAAVTDGFTLMYTGGQPSVNIPPILLNVGRPLIGSIRPLMIVAIVFIGVMELILRKTSFGRSLYLIGSNRRAAYLCGLRVDFIVIMAYVLAGIIACTAGLLLVGYTGSGQLKMGSAYTMLSIAAVVIGGTKVSGGKGTLIGGALGAIVLILLTSILVAVGLQAGVRQLIQGLILLLILVINCKNPKLRQ